MAALPLKNAQPLTSACRSSGAHVLRRAHASSSSFNHSTAALVPGLVEEISEITLPPMFDIFDAPAKLAQSGEFIRSKYAGTSARAKAASAPTSTTTASTSTPIRALPTPLPQPVIFDGPARPHNAVLAFQSRMRDAGLRTQKSATRTPPHNVPARPFSSSEPLVQMFDGPARITRYHHRPSGSSHPENKAMYAAALGLVGTVGYATVLKED